MKAVLLLALTLGGCAERGDFPSLRPRPFEAQAAARVVEPPPPPPAPADPALTARVRALLAQGEEGERTFRAEIGAVEAAIGRAGAAESDSWIEGQTELSGLDAARAATLVALSDLDGLLSATTGETDRATIREASARLAEIVAAQDAVLDRLSARLSPA